MIFNHHPLFWIKPVKDTQNFIEKIKLDSDVLPPYYGWFEFHEYIGLIRPNKGGE
ncbi:MAG: hypothetical protein C5S49_04940 [Candidatus Methanogaster sp.]|nr:MAG: hypothetical protein C5S49_04940 [ANME-2 cluster archaeon]